MQRALPSNNDAHIEHEESGAFDKSKERALSANDRESDLTSKIVQVTFRRVIMPRVCFVPLNSIFSTFNYLRNY